MMKRRTNRHCYRLYPVALCLLFGSGTLGAHSAAGDPPPGVPSPAEPRGYGKVALTHTVSSAEAAQAFTDGLKLLHLFEYPAARRHFQQARALAPEWFMPYWGEAMTHNAPLWNQYDRPAGQAVLALWAPDVQARRARLAGDAPGLAWLTALDILYGDLERPARDRAYAAALAQAAADFPADDEFQLFYALALLGRHGGVRDHADYMQAAALAAEVLDRQPEHPGAAHYLIHGVDDAIHAPLGLTAARRLAEIAPDAPHAQHMASHIFLALGLWPETAAANRRAIDARRRFDGTGAACGHYPVWLHYALLQQGQSAEAARQLEACRQAAAQSPPPARFELDPDDSARGSLVQMWARQWIDGRAENDGRPQPAAGPEWTPDPGEAAVPMMTVELIQALRAYDRDDSAAVAAAERRFGHWHALLQAELTGRRERGEVETLYLERAAVLAAEVAALAAAARGDSTAALVAAAHAAEREAAMPAVFGPPFVDWPAAELYAELLQRASQQSKAAAILREQLATYPGRRPILRRLEALGRSEKNQTTNNEQR